MRELGTPLAIHQPSYSMFNRWIEPDLVDALRRGGRRHHRVLAAGAGPADRTSTSAGCPTTPLRPRGARSRRRWSPTTSSSGSNALAGIAESRGRTLAQLALSWALRDERVTSVLIGARTVAQLEDSLGALDRLDFTDSELADIDKYAVEAGLNLWARSNEA